MARDAGNPRPCLGSMSAMVGKQTLMGKRMCDLGQVQLARFREAIVLLPRSISSLARLLVR